MFSIRRRDLLMLPLLLSAALAYTSAFLLRFEFALPTSVEGLFRLGLFIFIPAKGMAYWIFRLHANRWRLVSLFDLYRIVLANITASALACLVTVSLVGGAFPRSIYVIDAALCILATAGIPFGVRLYWEEFVEAHILDALQQPRV